MATFESTYSDTLTVAGSVDAVRAHFADLATIVANTKDLEKADIEGDVIHFLLEKQEHMGIGTFQGQYACRYTTDSDGNLSWSPVGDGNTRQSGKAVFTAVDDGTTRVEYTESLSIDMDVPAMMAPMLKPLIGPMLKHEMAEYAKRMVKAIGWGTTSGVSTSPQEELDALLDARLATDDPAARARIDAEIRARFLEVRAVLITDMSGFSRLTQEEGILHFLAMVRRMREEVATRVAAAGGRLVKFEADNVYAAFDHPDDALAATIDLLAFCANEAERPPHEAIGLSIGLSWGDVLDLDGAEFYGDPVNLASKLGEDTAERNEALATEAFVDALAEHKGWLWEKHETRISGIKLPYYSLHRVR